MSGLNGPGPARRGTGPIGVTGPAGAVRRGREPPLGPIAMRERGLLALAPGRGPGGRPAPVPLAARLSAVPPEADRVATAAGQTAGTTTRVPREVAMATAAGRIPTGAGQMAGTTSAGRAVAAGRAVTAAGRMAGATTSAAHGAARPSGAGRAATAAGQTAGTTTSGAHAGATATAAVQTAVTAKVHDLGRVLRAVGLTAATTGAVVVRAHASDGTGMARTAGDSVAMAAGARNEAGRATGWAPAGRRACLRCRTASRPISWIRRPEPN